MFSCSNNHCSRTFFILFLFSFGVSHGQGLDELRKKKQDLETALAPLQAQTEGIQAELNKVNATITSFPGWYSGAFGTVGANVTGRNQWFSAGDLKDSRAATIQGSVNVFVNKLAEKYFWRNSASINVGWQKLKVTKEADAPFEPVADILAGSSLFGYKMSEKMAISGMGEYRTSVIRNFNNPGYLDAGIGMTLTPVKDLVIVVHPFNYNLIFASDTLNFTSSLGCKVAGDYNTQLIKGVHWRSNLTGFLSYKANNPSLHNGTWTNWFNVHVFKSLGIGLECALRYSEQEYNKLQFYYTAGVSYSL